MARLERITIGKALATLMSFVGVIMVALQDESSDAPGSFSGDALALVASACYGLYTVILRMQVYRCLLDPDLLRAVHPKQVPHDDIPMDLVLGNIGLINLICLSPICLLLVCI